MRSVYLSIVYLALQNCLMKVNPQNHYYHHQFRRQDVQQDQESNNDLKDDPVPVVISGRLRSKTLSSHCNVFSQV